MLGVLDSDSSCCTAPLCLEFQEVVYIKALKVMTQAKHCSGRMQRSLYRKPFISRRHTIGDDLSRNNNGSDNSTTEACSLASETSLVMTMEFL